ncbi:MAG: putative oxidoreductase [Mycobacterium sp.]|nr:putative oxidoreductase [Mycobacterium sp.]
MSRAVRFDHYGDGDVLYVADVEVPVPAPGEVVVKVRAAGINPGEMAIRSGALAQIFPATFPSGEGSDLAGVVSAIGDGVTEFAVGDEVLGWSETRSSHAEYTAVPIKQLIAKPTEVSWEVAGSLYVIACTAYAAVRAVAVQPGDTVAVSAAAGGVGSVVVQLLKTKGATVLGIASPNNHEWLKAHGVIPIAYGDGLADRLKAAAPNGIDAFIDLFGPDYVQLAADLGIKRDRIETIISRDKAAELGTKVEGSSDASTTEVLSEMADLVASGQIEIPISATYPLEKVRDAFTELAARHTHGKIVLIP